VHLFLINHSHQVSVRLDESVGGLCTAGSRIGCKIESFGMAICSPNFQTFHPGSMFLLFFSFQSMFLLVVTSN
jgi:hypothetical protein